MLGPVILSTFMVTAIILKANGEPVSIFVFDATSDGNDSVKPVAVASIKWLKTLRHPNVLTFVDR